VNRGIENAQKKVEERNFNIRKNLLEYDEVMDHQRKTFYELRQQIVEGRQLSELIWVMIDETVTDAVQRYYDPTYAAQCVVEWAGQHLGAMIDASKLDTSDLPALQGQVRDMAANEIHQNIQRTFGEYIDPDVPPEDWDVRGFATWTAQYGMNLTQNQVRKAAPDELLDQVLAAAEQRVQEAELTPLEQYVDPLFAKARLVRWAREKFDVEIPLDDIASANREDAEQVLTEKMRAAYRQREIEYPASAVVEFALQRGGTNRNEVYGRIAQWANRKFGVQWDYEHFDGKSPDEVYREICDLNRQYLNGSPLAGEIDRAVAEKDGEALRTWAQERFGAVMDAYPLDLAGDLKDQLKTCAYQMLRFELTQLERYVMLTTLDSVWKDHMYGMDLLRHSIGLRGYAEQDPKIAYKREGTRTFNEMLENYRERVTDLIFKVRIAGFGEEGVGQPAPGGGMAGGAYAGATSTKADATGAGFSSAAEDQDAAMRQQGEGAKPQTIRRETPKVGRNDPCPCGSGKKYKQCHGKAS
jgi:preprotein translocase subunit SecA